MTNAEAMKKNILIYTGPGSSNSWVWLADFLERHGFLGSMFVTDIGEIHHAANDSILIIPGGDTFRIAGAFGESSLSGLKDKIARGMGYLGICAGAYLPLRSSISPLSSFNLLSAKISNISSALPAGVTHAEKYSVRYGCSYVFHPARGPVKLSGDANLIAPIYGGPFLAPSDEVTVRLTFSGTTEGTELLVDRGRYERVSRGKAACIEGRYGGGKVIAMAPHLEHPDYPEANEYFRNLLLEFPSGERKGTSFTGNCANVKELRSVIADLRVLANSLDTRSWKIGVKYWESDKLMFYIDAIRKRIVMDTETSTAPSDVLASLQDAKRDLNELNESDDEHVLESAVENLSAGASLFLTAHFARLHEQLAHDSTDRQR
jgi:hypothetical protein